MKISLKNIQNHKDYKTFIAAIDKQILGMVGLTKNYFYEQNGIYVRVLVLVTSSEFRQTGIVKKLMVKAENWTKEIGAETVLLLYATVLAACKLEQALFVTFHQIKRKPKILSLPLKFN
jgi:GNAT superfamily N-acetyltransferase